jgi:hypothetical protein
MEIAIQVIWWIALIAALIGTLVVLKQVVIILGILQSIHHLSGRTLEAARGIEANVRSAPTLPPLDDPSAAFHQAAAELRAAVESLESRLGALAAGRLQGGR